MECVAECFELLSEMMLFGACYSVLCLSFNYPLFA